jgi:hypothetical protein
LGPRSNDCIGLRLKFHSRSVSASKYPQMPPESWLKMLLKCVGSCLKWKICYISELKTWTKDSVALLSDACHPTPALPSSRSHNGCRGWSHVGGTGGSPSQNTSEDRKRHIPQVLRFYEAMRKRGTMTNVRGESRIDSSSRWPTSGKWKFGTARSQTKDLSLESIEALFSSSSPFYSAMERSYRENGDVIAMNGRHEEVERRVSVISIKSEKRHKLGSV